MTEAPAEDIRWQQRFSNYQRALVRLQEAVALQATRPLSNLEQQGLIQAFEFTHELAWNVMKDYFVYQGNATPIAGSRDAVREAFAVQLVIDGQGWMDMIKSRNLSSHTYNTEVADAIVKDVVDKYAALFAAFARHMAALIRA
jgi:nucleotidyltransferase substrate binding protein (TIGR01987 family)